MSKPTNPQQLAAEFELYKRIKLLGEGAFGKAYLVEDLQTHQLLVQKQMDMKAMSPEEKRETYKEAKILQQLNHPNIVKFQEVYTTKKGKLCIIMEYADGGDLARVVKDAKGKYLQEKQILDWFTQICLAIKHVHDRKIIHRDLKGQNIFLTKSQMVKLGDFGIARVLSKTVEKAKTMVGTPYYLSPEIIESKPYSLKTDIWSLGVILYELCALKPPFNADSLHFLALKIVKGQFSPIPAHYSREMKNLIQILLQVDPVRRPSINDIMKLPIINERVKNFLSETIRQIEFSHTILHNKIIDAKVNIADIKVVNNEAPCPQNLLDEMKKQAQQQQQKLEPSPSQPSIQQPQGKVHVGPSAVVAHAKQANPIMQYANNYRQGNQDQKNPNSAQLAQQQQIIQQQKAQQQQQQQEYEKKKELEKLRMAQLEKERMQKEKDAYEKLQREKEDRIRRQREQSEKEQLKKQKERDELLQQQQALQKPVVPVKREEQGAGGVGVYGNPNFKPQPMKGAIGKPPQSAQPNIKKPVVQNNGSNNKGSGSRSGSSSARSSSAQQRQQIQKKAEEDKQRAQELKLQRQRSESERKEAEARIQKEKDEDREKKKEEQAKKIDQQREQMKQDRDRKKWDKGGAKFEFVQRSGGSSSQNDLDDATTVASSEQQQQQKSAQKAPVVEREKPKKWDVKPNQKKGEWNVEIFESVKKPIVGNNNNNLGKKEEQLLEYNSDSETKEQENQKQKMNKKQQEEEKNQQQKNQNLAEYNSEDDDEEETKEIVECIDQEESKIEEVNENTFLRQFDRDNLQNKQKKHNSNDDTTFQIDVDVNDPKFMNYVNDLQNIVADVAEKAENMQIDDKFIRNNAFDFTKTTAKTQKKLTPLAPKELSEQKDDDMGEREDDPEELGLAVQTGQFLEDFPEPPKLQQKILSKDEEESINVISSGYEGLEELYLRLEQELGDKFKLAYNIMKEELKNLSGLNELEKKYGQSKYRDILNFLSDEEIEKYLRLILTLIVLEEKLLDLNSS